MALPIASVIRDRTLKSVTGTGLDAQINAMVSAADEYAARYCMFPQWGASSPSMDKDSAASTYVLYYDGPNRYDARILNLNLRPIVSITSVLQDLNGDWGYAQTAVENTDFVKDYNGRLILHPNSTQSWLVGMRAIKVTAVAGFDTGADPLLTEILALIVAHWWTTGYAPTNVQTITAGAQSVTMAVTKALPQLARDLLDPFRLVEREMCR